MTTLTAMRLRVRSHVDDIENVEYSDSEIDDALKEAQRTVWLMFCTSGASVANITATDTSGTDGFISLAPLEPMRLVSVHEVLGTAGNGQVFRPIMPLRPNDPYVSAQAPVNVQITYVPRVTFPASGAADFIWGSLADSDTPDMLAALLAASTLKIKEGEVLPGLQERVTAVQQSLMSMISIPTWGVTRMANWSPRNCRYFYRVVGAGSLQIVLGQ